MLGLGSPKLPDDRGTPVEIWSPSSTDWQQLTGTEGDIPRRVIERILSAWRDPKNSLMRAPFTRENRPFVLMGGLAILAYVVGIGVMGFLRIGAALFVAGFAMLFALVWRMLQLRWRKARLGTAVRETLLAEGLCACCAYRLNGLHPEPDGCTVCPECRAAWKLRPDLELAAPEPADPLRSERPPEFDGALVRRILTFGALGRPRVLATLDDAGRLVELVDCSPRRYRPLAWDQLSPAEQAALSKHLRWYGWWRRVLFALVALLYCFFGRMVFVRVIQFTPSLSMGYLLNMLPLVAILFGVLTFIGLAIRPPVKNRRRFAQTLLNRGLCPCCLTHLRAEPRDQAGRTTCPRCRSTWRVPSLPTSGATVPAREQ